MRHVDRHPGRIHARHHLGAEPGESPVAGRFAAVAEPVFGVISELRQPLAHLVELVHIVHAAQVIRILHAQDDPDPALLLRPREVVRASHAQEIIRMPRDQAVPFLKPCPGDFMRLPGLERDGGMKNVDPGTAQLPEVAVGESRRILMPSIEQRPVQGQQAKHVDDIRLRDQIDGTRRIPS